MDVVGAVERRISAPALAAGGGRSDSRAGVIRAKHEDLTVAIGGSTTNLHNLILTSLKKAAFVNPLTLAGQVPLYPDTAAAGTGLARTFYFVTNGAPTLTEEQFISYATNYNQEAAYTSNGYFSQYDMTSA